MSITTGNTPAALQGDRRMGKLTAKERKSIPGGEFALPGRRYPVEDKAHARNALARVAQHGTPAEKATVRRKVHEKYPEIGAHHYGHGNAHHRGHGAAHKG